MEINKEEFKSYLVAHRSMKEDETLLSSKLRTNEIKGIGHYIDYTIMGISTNMSNGLSGSWGSSGSSGSSVILDDYLRWLREYKLNEIING
jgi:hypothetical protein